MGQNYGPKLVTDGLVLSLDPADKNCHLSGSGTVTDLSPLGNDATISGSAEANGPTFTSSDPVPYFSFDGTDDQLFVTGCDLGTAGVTYICWFRTSTEMNNTYLIAQGKNLTGSNGYDLGFHGANFGSFCITTSGAASNVLVATDFHDGAWHCGACVYNETKNLVYYDGALHGTGGNASGGIDIESTNRLTIGSWVNSPPTSHATTDIGLVLVYNVALDAKQILQNFNAHRARFGV